MVYSIKNELVSKILDMSDRHVKEMLQGILSCEIYISKAKETAAKLNKDIGSGLEIKSCCER